MASAWRLGYADELRRYRVPGRPVMLATASSPMWWDAESGTVLPAPEVDPAIALTAVLLAQRAMLVARLEAAKAAIVKLPDDVEAQVMAVVVREEPLVRTAPIEAATAAMSRIDAALRLGLQPTVIPSVVPRVGGGAAVYAPSTVPAAVPIRRRVSVPTMVMVGAAAVAGYLVWQGRRKSGRR